MAPPARFCCPSSQTVVQSWNGMGRRTDAVPKEVNFMNKSELAAAVAEEAGITKKNAEAAINAFIKAVAGELGRSGEVQITGFGSFRTSARAARTGRNPRTGEEIRIDASTVPVFRAGKTLKEAVRAKNSKKGRKGKKK